MKFNPDRAPTIQIWEERKSYVSSRDISGNKIIPVKRDFFWSPQGKKKIILSENSFFLTMDGVIYEDLTYITTFSSCSIKKKTHQIKKNAQGQQCKKPEPQGMLARCPFSEKYSLYTTFLVTSSYCLPRTLPKPQRDMQDFSRMPIITV